MDKVSLNKIIENYIKSIDANHFQDFCDRLLITIYPEDYIPVRAGGRYGDMKNDGYCYLNRIFFQAHASRSDSIANIEKKIQTDIEGCLRQQRDVKKFVYITNDIQVGKVENFIDKLRKIHSTCEIETWSPKKIAILIDSFPTEKIEYVIDCNLTDYEKLNYKANLENNNDSYRLLTIKDIPSRFLFISFFILLIFNWKSVDLLIKFLDSKKIILINPQIFPNLNIAIFAVLSLLIFLISFIIILKRARKRIKCSTRKGITFEERKKIIFPQTNFIENPIFEERIKELFEFKYLKNNLTLERLTSDKILYGNYKEGFREYYIVVYCDDNHNNKKVTRHQISDLNLKIEENILPNIIKNKSKNTLVDIYYISELCKTFGNLANSTIICQSENDLLNTLVDFTPYLNRLIDKFKQEKVFSAITKDEDKKTIFETFIEPAYKVSSSNNIKNDLKKYIDNWLIDSSNSKHLVLLGDYGMGKTTFLKHYSATLAQEIIAGKEIKRFPVFISLTNTSPMHGGITKSLGAFVAENLGISFALFEKLIQKGKLLFILDAFDEMGFIGTHEQRFRQFQEIWTLATKNNKIILSGRPSYFSTDIELKEFLNIPDKGQELIQTEPYCEQITLCNLDTNRIKEYIHKYYPNELELYWNWIFSNKSILDLCRRPSLMHMVREMLPYLLENKIKMFHTSLPVTAGETINLYIEYWVNRQESKNIQSAFEGKPSEKKEFIISFFSELAVELNLSGKFKIESDEVLFRLRKKINNEKIKGFERKENLEGFENEILTGYFIEIENSQYRFVHNSFFEYFVAIKIIDSITKKRFREKLLYSDWSNEIVDFIYDTIPIEFRQHNKIPALILLGNSNLKAKFKFLTTKWYLLYSDTLGGLIGLAFIIYIYVLYFKYFDLHWIWDIILFIPILIVSVLVYSFCTSKIDSFVTKTKGHRFLTKAFKISFIKSQFQPALHLKLFIKLLRSDIRPFIPLTNMTFDNQLFEHSRFYKLEKVNFQRCKFSSNFFSNSILRSVDFNDSVFSLATNFNFQNCELINVNFDNINIEWERQNVKYNQIDIQRKTAICFTNCLFDWNTINSLKRLCQHQKLKVGKDIIGDSWLINELTNKLKNK